MPLFDFSFLTQLPAADGLPASLLFYRLDVVLKGTSFGLSLSLLVLSLVRFFSRQSLIHNPLCDLLNNTTFSPLSHSTTH